MAQGKPNKLICRELHLAEGTVKCHVSAILRALEVGSRSQAALKAARLGLGVVNAENHLSNSTALWSDLRNTLRASRLAGERNALSPIMPARSRWVSQRAS